MSAIVVGRKSGVIGKLEDRLKGGRMRCEGTEERVVWDERLRCGPFDEQPGGSSRPLVNGTAEWAG